MNGFSEAGLREGYYETNHVVVTLWGFLRNLFSSCRYITLILSCWDGPPEKTSNFYRFIPVAGGNKAMWNDHPKAGLDVSQTSRMEVQSQQNYNYLTNVNKPWGLLTFVKYL